MLLRENNLKLQYANFGAIKSMKLAEMATNTYAGEAASHTGQLKDIEDRIAMPD